MFKYGMAGKNAWGEQSQLRVGVARHELVQLKMDDNHNPEFQLEQPSSFLCEDSNILVLIMIIVCSFLCHFFFGAQGPLHKTK